MSNKITTSLLMEAICSSFSSNPDEMKSIMSFYNNFQNEIQIFENEVWFDGLQKILQHEPSKGMRADYNDIVVLTYCVAGRVLITMEQDIASVTLITDESSQRSCMGLQGIMASNTEAFALIRDVIQLWKAGNLKFKVDKKVGLF